MENLYFKAFEKYGAALASLYPSQIDTLIEALEEYSETGRIPKIQDRFVWLACMMILCDERHRERTERETQSTES